MGYATAKTIDADVIPVIDISPLIDGSDPVSVARKLHSASKGLGFIYVKGHGIPEEVIERAREVAFEFFRAPEELKATVRITGQHRGWLARGGAKMRDDVKADLKESFIWGYENGADGAADDHPLRGQNLWPAAIPDLREVAQEYFQLAHQVAHHLMWGFAIGLNLPENFFLRTSDRPISRASFVYYPAQPASLGEEQFGVGPHTDFGVLTVLCQDAVGGLQVEDANGEWVHAPPIEGTLVVNVGDLLARWTDGEYKSTPHRVVNSSGKERLSLVVAYDPNPETAIDAREVFGDGHVVRNEPITCGEYLEWRFAKAFSYRK
ncbi:2-oxoglutarate-dependent ethylene/succinate-forming enzyme [Roseovarius aestuarii]|uniref:2-oxoglutarate-dependent ethylene/succinate-forming enzyme n=2 Tax=Roseovarius aestuarii TaxID=475083 RepID=A0A1X7BPU8_9RHOB|nr:2-oxoglutarate-dependent ethylene/succinate-forming enzyme [Roseovarius aestuarii]